MLSTERVRLAKQVFAVAMVVFWAAVTNHCGLEVIPALKFLACAPQSQPAHGPSHCGDEKDACATVEGGLYKSENIQISPGKIPVTPVLLTLFSHLHVLDLEFSPGGPTPEATPPELSSSWQFSLRTALSPRAPSIRA